MPTNFPANIDTFINPAPADPLTNPAHAAQHANANDAINAIETAIGKTGDVSASTLRGQIAAKADSNHTHSAYALTSHGHQISQITGLQQELDSINTQIGNIASRISVKDYGAKGDGITDDMAAIVAADNAAALKGEALFFPAGTYLVGSQVTNLKSSWYGESKSIVRASPSLILNSEAMLTWYGLTGIVVNDITFDFQSRPITVGSEGVIAFVNCEDFSVSNCRVINLTGTGIAINGGINFVIQNCFISKLAVAQTYNQAILVSSSSRKSKFGWITHNYCVNSAINVECHQIWIKDNDIEGWGFGGGITTQQEINNSLRVWIINNIIKNGSPLIDVNNTRTAGVENWAAFATITGNIIYNNGGTGIDCGGPFSIISHNQITNNGNSGTSVPYVSGGNGINIRYGDATYNGSNCTIHGNYIGDTRASPANLQGYAVSDQSPQVTGTLCYENRYVGNGLGEENFQGTTARKVVSGSKGGNAALASLITAMKDLGLIQDTTT
jgi:hypothetical protein